VRRSKGYKFTNVTFGCANVLRGWLPFCPIFATINPEKEAITVTMGEKILNLRKARGWSQEELADRIGVTRQAVSRWESNSAKPDADKLIALCREFEVTADYLLGMAEQKDSPGSENKQRNLLQRIKNKIDHLSTTQLAAMALCLFGGISIFVLQILSVLYPVEYIHVSGNGREERYTGLWGYIKGNYLDFFFLLAIISLIVGAGVLMSFIIQSRKCSSGEGGEKRI
jgi:transcriptional regulator with XRE-family HTH domain